MIEGLFWGLFLGVVGALIHATRGRLGITRLKLRSPIGVFLATHSLNVIGALWVLGARGGPGELRLLYLTMIFAGTLAPVVGAWLAAEYLRMVPGDTLAFLNSEPTLRLSPRRFGLLVGTSTLLCLAFLFTLWRIVGDLPVLAAIAGAVTGDEMKLLRASTYKTISQTITHPMNFFRVGVVPFLVCAAAARAVWTSKRLERFLLVFVVAMGVVYNSYASALYPVALLFVLLALSWQYLGTLDARKLLIAGVGALSFPIVWGAAVLVQGRSVAGVALLELTRHGQRFLFLIPDVMWSYVELYSGPRGHLLGGAHRPLAVLFRQPSVNAANEVFLYRDPDAFFLGNATAPYESYFFADFGIPGVLVGGVLVGVILQVAHYLAIRSPLSELTLARFVLVCWGGYSVTLSSAFTGVASKGLFFALVLPFLIRLFFARGVRRTRRSPQGAFAQATGRSP
jgi:hypothetical protein